MDRYGNLISNIARADLEALAPGEAGLASLRVVGGRTLLDAGLVEQAGNAVGRLGANAEPVLHAVFDQTHAVGVVLGQQRVVGADLLEVLAVTRGAAVGDDDLVVGALLGTATRQPQGNRHQNYLSLKLETKH